MESMTGAAARWGSRAAAMVPAAWLKRCARPPPCRPSPTARCGMVWHGKRPRLGNGSRPFGRACEEADGGSHAQREQFNRAETDYEDNQRDVIVIQPMPGEHMHDDFPENQLVEARSFPADGQWRLSPSLVASARWAVQTRRASAANPEFAHIVRQGRLRTSGSKAALES